MTVRGLRGATTIKNDQADEIIQSTKELLMAILEANPSLDSDDIASVIFSVTADISAAFPARAARELGWNNVPLLDTLEMTSPGALQRCIRVLIHWNTDLNQKDLKHIYLRDAKELRPDLTGES